MIRLDIRCIYTHLPLCIVKNKPNCLPELFTTPPKNDINAENTTHDHRDVPPSNASISHRICSITPLLNTIISYLLNGLWTQDIRGNSTEKAHWLPPSSKQRERMSSLPPFQSSPAGGRKKSRFTYRHLAQLALGSATCPLRVIAHVEYGSYLLLCRKFCKRGTLGGDAFLRIGNREYSLRFMG